MGIIGIFLGLILIVIGFDRVNASVGVPRILVAFLPLVGLALAAACILYAFVPGFFNP